MVRDEVVLDFGAWESQDWTMRHLPTLPIWKMAGKMWFQERRSIMTLEILVRVTVVGKGWC